MMFPATATRMRSLRSHARPAILVRLATGLATLGAACAVAAPAGAAQLLPLTGCPGVQVSQPFSPWLDFASYELVPGGSFEAGQPAWSLQGGARVAAGNESFQVGDPADSASLALPGGATATSPSVCVGVDNPTLRFFVRNTGSPLGTLEVVALYHGPLGLIQSLPVAEVVGGPSWQPTLPNLVLVNLLTLVPGDGRAVSFRLIAHGGAWNIDDVYLDPWFRS